jgi:hypothetical protein
MDSSFSPADFSQLKEIIKAQNDDLVRKAENALPGLMDNINNFVEQKARVETAISVLDVMALPPHDDTDRSISYSLFEKSSVSDHAGALETRVGVATISFLHVKGKVLILHCLAEEDGLAWSRAALKRWSDAILAANSS